MDLGTGIALLIAFLAVVVLIIRGQSPIIMLLILAVLWSAIAGIGIDDIQKKILQAGGVAYASAVIIIVFGAWFAQMICGMIIVAGQTPEVANALKPIFSPVLPHTTLQAAIFFGVLGGIGSIYRGPLVVIGTGAALLAIVLANKDIPIPYLYSIWLAPTILQGSMDPTNSWTLWTIGQTRVSHGQFLKTAPPFGCMMVAVNSLICYLMLGSLD
jgi:hypothetical protein